MTNSVLYDNELELKVESYRRINRELTDKNQQLRKTVNSLYAEISSLNQKLLEERQSKEFLKRTLFEKCSRAVKTIIHVIYPEIENDSEESAISSNSTNSFKKNQENHLETANLIESPAEIVSYVQSSRSPLAEISFNKVTQRLHRADDTKLNSNSSGNSNELIGENEGDIQAENISSGQFTLLPTIIEEGISHESSSSSDSHQSSTSEEDDSVKIVRNLSNVTLRTKTSLSRNNFVNISNESEQSCYRIDETDCTSNNRTLKKNTTEEDSTFNETNFSSLSILKSTSTPYKPLNLPTKFRNLKVCIPKLNMKVLSQISNYNSVINQSKESNTDKTRSSLHSKKKSLSAKRKIKNIKNDQSSPSIIDSKRPKRKAAEAASSTLVERTLKVKLRRPF